MSFLQILRLWILDEFTVDSQEDSWQVYCRFSGRFVASLLWTIRHIFYYTVEDELSGIFCTADSLVSLL